MDLSHYFLLVVCPITFAKFLHEAEYAKRKKPSFSFQNTWVSAIVFSLLMPP